MWISAIDVTNPSSVTSQEVLLSQDTDVTCDSFSEFDNVGMALSVNEGKLFIANPAKNRVEVFDTTTNTLGTAIPVGSQPLDVAIVRAGGSGGPERAYVLSQLDRAIYIVDVSDPPQVIGTPILLEDPDNPDPTRRPVAISVRSDGLRAFTADGMHGTLTVVDITPLFEKWLGTISVGGTATRLGLLKVP